MGHRQKRQEYSEMSQEIYSPKSLRKRKSLKNVSPAPDCRQLAERFMELQNLRLKVRAAETERMVGTRQTVERN
jgi:hypothetical protein